jgi:hypothetical protein
MKRWPVFDAVPFENGNSLKMIGEHPRGRQSSQATADNQVIQHAFLSFYPLECFNDRVAHACASHG